MTDRMAALRHLSLRDVPERAAALNDFYNRYAGDPLIVDKWLALQASIPERATLDRVEALTAHPAFSFGNPNRVRALIGAFAAGNQTQFNRPDGAGYDFVVETVLALDGKNPQLAARLLAFTQELARARSTPPSARGGSAAPRVAPHPRCRWTSATSSSGRSAKPERLATNAYSTGIIGHLAACGRRQKTLSRRSKPHLATGVKKVRIGSLDKTPFVDSNRK